MRTVQVATKPKFNKKKCLKCKYHGTGSGGHYVKVGANSTKVFCDYACITGNTCLRPIDAFNVVDLRGEEYNDCKLFKEGTADREREKFYM